MITPYYAGAMGLMFAVLSARVILVRRRDRVAFGARRDTDLERRIRVHANFAEYVPITLLLIGLAEWRGAAPIWIHGLGGLLVVGRLAHAIGLSHSRTDQIGRVVGMAGTLSALLGASLLCLLPAVRP